MRTMEIDDIFRFFADHLPVEYEIRNTSGVYAHCGIPMWKGSGKRKRKPISSVRWTKPNAYKRRISISLRL